MKQLLIINNIPTPYRTFMFNRMYEKGREAGIEVSVAFQSRREPKRRSWKPEDFDMHFPWFISSGLIPGSAKAKENFSYGVINTDIVAKVASGRYDWVLMSSFMSVTNWLTSLVPAGKTRKLLWSESNNLTCRHRGWLVQQFRRFLGRRYAALVCPGDRAVQYILQYDPKARGKTVISLPNIVDSSLFVRRVEQQRKNRDSIRKELGFGRNALVIVGVGEVVPRKGWDLLIDAASVVEGNYQIAILGEGAFRQEWISRVNDSGLADKVSMPGQCSQAELTRYLAAADWFIHPARHDPSPLVTIEAVSAGLPVAISRQTGNFPETVEDGVNGFEFDVCDGQTVVKCFERILGTTLQQRRAMGQASKNRAKKSFDPDVVIGQFFKDLNRLP